MHKQASERVYAVQALTFDESTHERTVDEWLSAKDKLGAKKRRGNNKTKRKKNKKENGRV